MSELERVDMLVSKCLACATGLHEECMDPKLTDEDAVDEDWTECCCGTTATDRELTAFGVGRPVMEPGDITDITSTGRRRAAMLYPVMEGMMCQWARLRFAGGG